HMERAFETQSSNAAIQSELQRLYGRRDGVEPPKIRMTRGALSHLYVQGELYPQAIAEIRAILTQEPDRADMQVLLARAYFRSGQKADASDMCAQLLKRYAYCFDANRIMVDLLPATAAAESTQVYRMRVGEMDPYANFARGSIFLSHEVPDAAVNLEKLDYKEEAEAAPQGWTPALSLGSAAAASEAAQPEWLKAGVPPESSVRPQPEEEIPDFLRQAGWGASTAPEQPTSIFDEEPAGGLTPAEIPDWLKAQEPVAADSTPAPQPPQDLDIPNWLDGDSSTAEKTAGEIPDWLKEAPAESTPLDATAAWLKELEDKSPAEPAADSVADWLNDLDKKETAPAEEVPDWLSGLEKTETASAPAEEVPDWLSGLEKTENSEAAPAEDIPDWLKSLDAGEPKSAPAFAADSLGASAQEQDDAVAWLESLAAKHGAKPEELVTDPSKRSEKPPEWVAQAQALGQETPPSSVENLGASAQEQDDAVAWLESLAAKHGAKPEELVTDPSKRSEKPPEWVVQAQSLAEAETPVPQEKPEIVEHALNVGEQFFAEFESASAAPPVNAASDWLRSLDEQEEKKLSSEEQAALEWFEEPKALERGEIPEWLREPASAEEEKTERSAVDAQPAEQLPDWLAGLEKETAPQTSAGGESDLTSWLNSLDDEPGLPFESMPTPDSILFDSQSRSSVQPAMQKPAQPETASSSLPPWLEENDEALEEKESLPEWLTENAETESVVQDDVPPWKLREQWENEGPEYPPTPTRPSDWHPLEPQVEIEKPAAERAFVPPPPTPSVPETPVSVKEFTPAPKKKKPALSPRKQPENAIAALSLAKSELDRGDIPAALAHYGKLIKKGKHIEETIRDLTESIYRYPVEVGIWQTLGDAYMRANRLKEALEAYNKAEELIR
ncbi:MAG: tetratricopeptide repeat protein, partial [Chloroflexi bacterium]|nr:tetratricopeptide repeat protein [Chloroflexota bacterium]